MAYIKLLTYAGFIKGLSAASLESQFFDEFVKLSRFLDSITVICAKAEQIENLPSNLNVKEVSTINLPKIHGFSKMLNYTFAPLKIRKNFNLIYVRTISPPEILSLWLLKTLLRIPSVIVIIGTCYFEPINLKNRFFRWILSNALRVSNKIVVYSDKMIPYIKKVNNSLEDKKFIVIHNAIDHNRFKPKPKNDSLLSSLGISKNEKVIMYVGKIIARKGVIDIINMAPSLLKKHDIKIVLIGPVEKNTIEYSQLTLLIKSLNLGDKVIITESISNAQIPEYLSCADVYVYLSKGCEGIPRSILEAMSCSKPIIATPIGGTTDAVVSGETGFIVNSYCEAAEKVDLLFSNKELYDKISQNCRNKIIKEFSYDVTVPKIVELFKSLIT